METSERVRNNELENNGFNLPPPVTFVIVSDVTHPQSVEVLIPEVVAETNTVSHWSVHRALIGFAAAKQIIPHTKKPTPVPIKLPAIPCLPRKQQRANSPAIGVKKIDMAAAINNGIIKC